MSEQEELRASERQKDLYAEMSMRFGKHWHIGLVTKFTHSVTHHWFETEELAKATYDKIKEAMEGYERFKVNDRGCTVSFEVINGGHCVTRLEDLQTVYLNPPDQNMLGEQ